MTPPSGRRRKHATGGRPRGVRGGTLADVDHTHPETRETFGVVYRRGPAATDGGRATDGRRRRDGKSVDADDEADEEEETIADVDHTPPYDEPKEIWSRGGEPTPEEAAEEAAAAERRGEAADEKRQADETDEDEREADGEDEERRAERGDDGDAGR